MHLAMLFCFLFDHMTSGSNDNEVSEGGAWGKFKLIFVKKAWLEKVYVYDSLFCRIFALTSISHLSWHRYY